MQLRRRADNPHKDYRESEVLGEFSDFKMKEDPLKLPKLNPAVRRVSSNRNQKDYTELPLINQQKSHVQRDLDGSDDLDQSQTYANSTDNMKKQIIQIKRKMNLSKYSENFVPNQARGPYSKDKHSQSSCNLRANGQTEEGASAGVRNSREDRRAKPQIKSQANITDVMDGMDSDISDFQQKMQANRVIVKNNAIKRKNDKSITNKPRPIEKQKKPNNPSLYQKRVKEYKDLSENKYLKEKKKQAVATDQKLRLKERELRIKAKNLSKALQISSRNNSLVGSRQGSKQGSKQGSRQGSRQGSPQQSRVVKKIEEIPISDLPREKAPNNQRRKSKLKQQILNQAPQTKPFINEDLFQSINQILNVKHKSRSEFYSLGRLSGVVVPPLMVVKKKLSINMKELQRNFRILQHKQNKLLGLEKQPQNLRALNKSTVEGPKLLSWDRVAVSDNYRELNIVHSNFVNQVDRINSFHTKNELSLEAYIANRSMLISMEVQDKLKELSLQRLRKTGSGEL